MIAVRRTAGIHSESDVVVQVRDKYYESLATGHRGNLITRIGTAAPQEVPEGYYLAAGGNNWWMYLSENLAGITPVQIEQKAAPTYDLNGRPVNRMEKGNVYIQKGRKLLQK